VEEEGDGPGAFHFDIDRDGVVQRIRGEGTGPIEACMDAIESMGLHFHLIEYGQKALDIEHLDFGAFALSEIKLQRKSGPEGLPGGPVAIGRGKDRDTIKANVKALVHGMNKLLAL
jgi:hypothetical protein